MMSQRNANGGGQYYGLFIVYFLLLGTIAPVIYALVFSYLESRYFTLDIVSPESFAYSVDRGR
jgi:hypothetical protein